MIYEYGVENGYRIIEWGARSYEEAIRWMGVQYADPLLCGIRVHKRINN